MLTDEQCDEIRKVFEDSVRGGLELDRMSDGSYHSHHTDMAWTAALAAYARGREADRLDAERLDWLEKTLVTREAETGTSCGWYVDESGAPIISGPIEAMWSRSLRAAIDAARAPHPPAHPTRPPYERRLLGI